MKSFLIKLFFILFIPFALFLLFFFFIDPFKTLNDFNLADVNSVNREYVSTELFLKNYNQEKYNSFVFGSSRACAINTYQWKSFLSENSKQFLFQAWVESITGVCQKLHYLEDNGVSINNALILIDIPSSFTPKQINTNSMTIKHYLLSKKSRFYYNTMLFIAFLKPSFIVESVRDKLFGKLTPAEFDPISNDWVLGNKYLAIPVRDSVADKIKFPKNVVEKETNRLINNDIENVLKDIEKILKKHATNYKIVITPDYFQRKISKEDLHLLQAIFGANAVYDYSGKNQISEDMYNFSDVNHFDSNIGWKIIDEIYTKQH